MKAWKHIGFWIGFTLLLAVNVAWAGSGGNSPGGGGEGGGGAEPGMLGMLLMSALPCAYFVRRSWTKRR